MNQITSAECGQWLEARGLELNDELYPVVNGANKSLEIAVPSESGRATSLAYLIGDIERNGFDGGIFVLREWNIWSEGLEAIRQQSICMMVGDENGVRVDEPLFLKFTSAEHLRVQAFLLQALLFRWDAFYVPNCASFAAFISHEAHIYLVPNGVSFSSDVHTQLSESGAQTVQIPYYLMRHATVASK